MPGRFLTQVLLLVVLCAAAVGSALAQPASAADTPARGSTDRTPPAIQIEATIGLGGVARRGEWTAIRLALIDSNSSVRPVAVRLTMRDDDGDIACIQRIVTLNPRIRQLVWLYAHLDARVDQSTPFTVSCHEYNPETDSVGRLIEFRRFTPSRVIEADEASIAVIGGRSFGLDQYDFKLESVGTVSTGHESTELVSGLRPQDLPDHWEGLAMFEAMLWGEGDPTELGESTSARAAAVREWVYRGGHLVVLLPAVGNPWFTGRHPLADIMPDVTATRLEDVSLEPYRYLLTTDEFRNSPLPAKTVVHSFELPEGVEPSDATPLLRGPHGVIAVRRLVGTGMVTVIGLDLSQRQLSDSRMLRADAFWHRILGKRFDTPTPAQLNPAGRAASGIRPDVVVADAYVALEVSQSAHASLGVLVGLFVFAAYWLLAGPGGFALLKLHGWSRHAWVAFVATSALFTAIAWAGATAIKPRVVRAQHLTFLDHVYGQSLQRARTWASILLPDYGDARVRVGEDPSGPISRNLMTPWSDPDGGTRMSFPDARQYIIDIREPWEFSVPTRATIKTFQFDWAGATPERWGSIRPAGVEKVFHPALLRPGDPGTLSGVLTHDLPGPLVDTDIILVTRQLGEAEDLALRRSRRTGAMKFHAFAWRLKRAWEKGQPLNLGTLDKPSSAEDYFVSLVPVHSGMGFSLVDRPTAYNAAEAREQYRMLAWYSMLEPPDYLAEARPQFRIVRRRVAHGWDLGKWFTQPCLIIVGQMSHAPSPTPLFVDDRAVHSDGTVVVRWVYPLQGDAPRFDGEE